MVKNQTINGTKTNNLIRGGDGNDTLIGNQGNDKLYGNKGRDSLVGGTGDDQLFGNQDSDILIGGKGKDILTGGTGSDLFFLVPETNQRKRADRIKDFNKANDFIVLGNGLTSSDVKLTKIQNSTLITAKKTGTILGIVEKVTPANLKYNLISGENPNEIGKFISFQKPLGKTLANGDVKLEIQGNDGAKFIGTLSSTTGLRNIRYVASSSSNIDKSFNINLNQDGSQINLKIDGDTNQWQIEKKDNDEIEVSLNNKVFMTLPPIPKNDDTNNTDDTPIDPLDPCKVFKEICENVKTINSILSWIPPLPVLTPLTSLQMGLEFTEYVCLLVLGDDKDLADVIASKTLSFIGDKVGNTMLNFHRKNNLVDKFLENNELNIHPQVFDSLKKTQEQNEQILGNFLGNSLNQSRLHQDFSSSIVNFINTKPNNSPQSIRSSDGSTSIMNKLRKVLGIDWCDQDKTPPAKPNIEITGPKEVAYHEYATFTISYTNPNKEAKGIEIMGFDGLTIGAEWVKIPEDKLESGELQFQAYNEDFFGSVDAGKSFYASLISDPSVFSYYIATTDPVANVNFLGNGGGWSGLPAQAIPVHDENDNFWVKWLS